MFRALFGGLWFEIFKGNESLFGGLGLFTRSQAIMALFLQFLGFGLVG
jgi:hypothetical protein